jgi:hypothetical protein
LTALILTATFIAIKIATTAAAECYGSEMIPFKARLMGDNKEHWMVYCFPSIPNDIEKQKMCYAYQTMKYETGRRFNSNDKGGSSDSGWGCPIVFVVLISKENGQVLPLGIP